jgi:hypothetical protein
MLGRDGKLIALPKMIGDGTPPAPLSKPFLQITIFMTIDRAPMTIVGSFSETRHVCQGNLSGATPPALPPYPAAPLRW